MTKDFLIPFIISFLAIINAIRAWKVYNLLQILDNKPKVSLLEFFDSNSVFAYFTFMTYVVPIKKAKYPSHYKYVRHINILVYLTYIFLSLLLLFIVIQ